MVKSNIIGRFERIDFPEFYVVGIDAKIDTGAYSGAMYATRIREEPEEHRLYFSPFNIDKEFSTDKFHKHWVRSSNGMAVERYFIDTRILLKGNTYTISISLADRSTMRYPVLLGRKFLRQNRFMVDVSKDNR